MQKELNSFSIYMPAYNLYNYEDPTAVAKSIRDNLTAKISENMAPIDNSFSLENFVYTTKELGN